MHQPKEHLQSFGRRQSRKLRQHQKDLLAEFLTPRDLTKRVAAGEPMDPASLMPDARRRIMEIGFGAGEHLAGLAKANPQDGFIGCEPFINGVASLLSRMEREGIDNILLHIDDVRDLLKLMPDASLDAVYILFPDPWPKQRHHKRRLIQKPLLDMIYRVLKPGAPLYIASDHADYVSWILAQCLAHEGFNWKAERSADWLEPYPQWTQTRYQRKAEDKDSAVSYLTFHRNI